MGYDLFHLYFGTLMHKKATITGMQWDHNVDIVGSNQQNQQYDVWVRLKIGHPKVRKKRWVNEVWFVETQPLQRKPYWE